MRNREAAVILYFRRAIRRGPNPGSARAVWNHQQWNENTADRATAVAVDPSCILRGPITIDFDNVADLSSVATSITRFTFSDATALTAGGASRANYSTASKQAWIVSTASCRFSKRRDAFLTILFKTFPPFRLTAPAFCLTAR